MEGGNLLGPTSAPCADFQYAFVWEKVEKMAHHLRPPLDALEKKIIFFLPIEASRTLLFL
jgi:hypothetical protein